MNKQLNETSVSLMFLLQEKARELRLKEFMEKELETKDKQLEKLVVRQQSVGHDSLL